MAAQLNTERAIDDPEFLEFHLMGCAVHEAGHAAFAIYHDRLGYPGHTFKDVWVYRSMEEMKGQKFVGALERGTIFELWKPGSGGSAAEVLWRKRADAEVCELIAGPLAEHRFYSSGEEGWCMDDLDILYGCLTDEDLTGASFDMQKVVPILKALEPWESKSASLLRLIDETAALLDRPDVWACITHVAGLLRRRGRLSYADVLEAVGLPPNR